MKTDLTKLGVKANWKDLTEGMVIAGAGTSKEFHTGEWSTNKPQFIEDKCTLIWCVLPVSSDMFAYDMLCILL